ncbi:unnamed protein product [Onchocerca flexuosa]|uniref:Reverse transcriptase n=1 Tax=Onchocerca flexuosa TaxID=387005 RepID=A0A183I573_9BILA|nr:unnamed protein product [Onchocerca flexuosa]
MFHHVKTADNPTDLASRGVLPKVLKDSSLWWNGPSWMVHPLERWPREEVGEEVQKRFTSNNYEQAKKLVVRMVQFEVSQKEIEKWGLVHGADGLRKSLGRLRWSQSRIMNFPYFICKGRIAELIVKQYHEEMFHASANLTWVKSLRENRGRSFWSSVGKERDSSKALGGFIYVPNHKSHSYGSNEENVC